MSVPFENTLKWALKISEDKKAYFVEKNLESTNMTIIYITVFVIFLFLFICFLVSLWSKKKNTNDSDEESDDDSDDEEDVKVVEEIKKVPTIVSPAKTLVKMPKKAQ